MPEVNIRVRDDGPFLIEGTVTITDGDGKPFPTSSAKPLIALCRCTKSANSPFCDGAHKSCGFSSSERAPN